MIISMTFLIEQEKSPKICIELYNTPTAKAIWSKKNKAKDIILPYFKIYYKVVVIKNTVLW
jgi:uncharacterized protein (UPF0333 family)